MCPPASSCIPARIVPHPDWLLLVDQLPLVGDLLDSLLLLLLVLLIDLLDLRRIAFLVILVPSSSYLTRFSSLFVLEVHHSANKAFINAIHFNFEERFICASVDVHKNITHLF